MKKIIPLLCIIVLQLIATSCKDDDTKDTPKQNTELLDSDNDGVIDSEDSDPQNPNKCKDSDNDGCDDCSITGADKSGGDPNNDGPDEDNDGICDSKDNKDTDNDGVKDSEDLDPENPNICRDVDKDGCDDCTNTGTNKSGGDPNNDGEDIDKDGICDENDDVINLFGIRDSDITLNPKKLYKLTGYYHITNNATLTIPAGTQIVSEKGNDKYIAILRGSKINVNGNLNNPVVIKSEGSQGDWGGLIICGKALTSSGPEATAEIDDIKYGGTDQTDNSGTINYLILKDCGAQMDGPGQFNGLTLYAVGVNTTISNIAVLNSNDDGIVFHGGNVNLTNIYTENTYDDAIDWTEGWNGKIENAFIKLTKAFDTAIEAGGVSDKPVIKNLTAESTVGGNGIVILEQAGATFEKLTLTGFDTENSFISRKNGIIENSTVDGSYAIANGVYNTSTTNEIDFSWVK